VILTAVMEWTAEEIATLRAAVASGILTVSYAGPPARTVSYQSLKEMRELLASMTSTSAAGTPYRLASTKKGF
jgi:hypothetical protein